MGTPRVGLDPVAVPQVLAGGTGEQLGRVPSQCAVAEELAADVSHDRFMACGQVRISSPAAVTSPIAVLAPVLSP